MELIDGVELLSKSKDYSSTGGGFMVLIIAVVFLVLSMYGFFQREYGVGIVMMVATICFLSLSLWLFFLPKPMNYKVTIDKSVTMEEFYQHYDIVSQEGKIYTVTVKEKK